MKAFELKAVQSGAEVCTRDGRKVRILCTDLHNERPIVAAVTGKDGTEFPLAYFSDGFLVKRSSLKNKGHEGEIFTEQRPEDLMIVEEKDIKPEM